ncbi:MAG: right-handed parallel beta-helix repeat-containing protein [Planctomycetota bacterium]
MNSNDSTAWLAVTLGLLFCVSGNVSAMEAAISGARSPQNERHISPTGDDTHDGGTAATAWQTWPFALSQLQPGDVLIVGEGTWTNGSVQQVSDPQPVLLNARLPAVDCDPSAVNPEYFWPYQRGTADAPITIRARNERKSLLRSDGRAAAFSIRHCEHWVLDGLRLEAADHDGGSAWSVLDIAGSQHLRLQRLLGRRNNRFHNSHIFRLVRCQKCVITESEAYEFHRHGFSISDSEAIEITRCYAHSRDRADICGGRVSHDVAQGMGDEGVVCYFSNHCLVQNVIVENCEGIQVTGDHNRVLGCIAMDGPFGFRFASNCQDSGEQLCRFDAGKPQEDTYAYGNHGENLVAIDCSIAGIDCDASGATTLRHVTMVACRTIAFWGRDRKTTAGFDTSFQVDYALALGFGGRVGIVADSSVTGTWGGKYLNAFGHSVNDFGPSASQSFGNQYGKWEKVSSIDPGLGANLVHVPKTSPMWQPDGNCIGANVLYRYEDGQLTGAALWSPATGEFPHGAVIRYVNDPASGPSAVDVHVRLRVNSSGGALPLGYQ